MKFRKILKTTLCTAAAVSAFFATPDLLIPLPPGRDGQWLYSFSTPVCHSKSKNKTARKPDHDCAKSVHDNSIPACRSGYQYKILNVFVCSIPAAVPVFAP